MAGAIDQLIDRKFERLNLPTSGQMDTPTGVGALATVLEEITNNRKLTNYLNTTQACLRAGYQATDGNHELALEVRQDGFYVVESKHGSPGSPRKATVQDILRDFPDLTPKDVTESLGLSLETSMKECLERYNQLQKIFENSPG